MGEALRAEEAEEEELAGKGSAESAIRVPTSEATREARRAEMHTVREFCERAFDRVGLPLRWEGEGSDERGYAPDGRLLIEVDPRYFRPTEVELLLGDPTKSREAFGWEPKVTFKELVEIMVDADLELVRRDVTLREAGFQVGEQDDD